jgi:hypothetical protein
MYKSSTITIDIHVGELLDPLPSSPRNFPRYAQAKKKEEETDEHHEI